MDGVTHVPGYDHVWIPVIVTLVETFPGTDISGYFAFAPNRTENGPDQDAVGVMSAFRIVVPLTFVMMQSFTTPPCTHPGSSYTS